MGTLFIQDSTLSSIANAIRAKAGKSDAFSPAQMVSEIENLPTGGGGDLVDFIENEPNGTFENSEISKVRSYMFYHCGALTSVNLPSATTIGSYVFYNCVALTSVNLPSVTEIGYHAFRSCYNLLSLYLTNSVICSLPSSNVFISTPIAGYTTSTGGVYGSIYVPASLLTSYKTATNWTVFSSRFVGV